MLAITMLDVKVCFCAIFRIYPTILGNIESILFNKNIELVQFTNLQTFACTCLKCILMGERDSLKLQH